MALAIRFSGALNGRRRGNVSVLHVSIERLLERAMCVCSLIVLGLFIYLGQGRCQRYRTSISLESSAFFTEGKH